MARGRKPRTWIKVDCEGILRGSVNYLLTLEGQAIWVKMIALSEVCGGRPGYIEDNNEQGLPRDYIAHELHCGVELLETVIERMSGDGAVKLNGSGSIQLVNFHHYQFSEYDRQKPYRDKKKAELPIAKPTEIKEKATPERKKIDFEEYVEELRPEYTDLNFDNEIKKFHLYWSEGNRKLQRPKLALKNWMDKAREFKQEGKGGTHQQRPRQLPKQYTQPDDL